MTSPLEPDSCGRRRIKIVYLITRSDTIGGAHVHVRDLAEAMSARGHTVTVVVGGRGPYVNHLSERGLTVVPLSALTREIAPISDAIAVKQIRRALSALRPDLVSMHSSKAGVLGRLGSLGMDIPRIFTAHGWSFAEGVHPIRRVLFGSIESLCSALADTIVTVSYHDRRMAQKWHVGARRKHVTIHNGVHDVPGARVAEPSRHPPRIVSVARLDDQKNHALLIGALAKLAHLEWTLDLIGDGPKEIELQDLVAAENLQDRIRFLGLRWDVPQQLADAQLFALISNWEGLPRSIIEAMRAGLPSVASDVGGVRELVDDPRTGHLVARGDLEGLVKILEGLLTHPRARLAMGAAARKLYERHFTFERLLEETMDLYESVTGLALAR